MHHRYHYHPAYQIKADWFDKNTRNAVGICGRRCNESGFAILRNRWFWALGLSMSPYK